MFIIEKTTGFPCNCCHNKDGVKRYTFEDDINGCGIVVYLCRRCRDELKTAITYDELDDNKMLCELWTDENQNMG